MSKRKIIEIYVEEKENDDVDIRLQKVADDEVADEVMNIFVSFLGRINEN